MGKRISLINNIKIATPCHANWQEMSGDNNQRFCQQCQLNVYNISNLTERQIEELFIAKEGKLCVRLYRRKDGTVITSDCPTELKLLQQRTNKIAKAVVSSCLTLLTTFFIAQNVNAQNLIKADLSINKVETNKINDEQSSAIIYGVVADESKASIGGTKMTIINEKNNDEITIRTDESGSYKFSSLKPGKYIVKAETEGFQTIVKEHINLKSNQQLQLNLTMKVNDNFEMGGLIISSCEKLETIITDSDIDPAPKLTIFPEKKFPLDINRLIEGTTSQKPKQSLLTEILTSPVKLFHKLFRN